MKKLILLIAVVMLFAAPVASAHIHPLVPANQCGLGDGAGNTSDPQNGDNGQGFIGTGFIPAVNPGKANVSLPGPGVDPATANCTNA